MQPYVNGNKLKPIVNDTSLLWKPNLNINGSGKNCPSLIAPRLFEYSRPELVWLLLSVGSL